MPLYCCNLLVNFLLFISIQSLLGFFFFFYSANLYTLDLRNKSENNSEK